MFESESAKLGLPERAGLALLTAYRYGLSPIFYALGVRCRHEPTCSAYAADAVRAQGLWRGCWLALGRVLRCRPGGTQGYDPAGLRPAPVAWWKVWAFREWPAQAGGAAPGSDEGH